MQVRLPQLPLVHSNYLSNKIACNHGAEEIIGRISHQQFLECTRIAYTLRTHMDTLTAEAMFKRSLIMLPLKKVNVTKIFNNQVTP